MVVCFFFLRKPTIDIKLKRNRTLAPTQSSSTPNLLPLPASLVAILAERTAHDANQPSPWSATVAKKRVKSRDRALGMNKEWSEVQYTVPSSYLL